MYPNGPAHVGHARTYIIPDVIARFKRGIGYNVLFPMGFHYTGTPILTTAERIASGEKEYIRNLSNAFGVPETEIRKLTKPLKLARYFHRLSKNAMREYGLSIDWRREFTTIDPEFNSFIRWQFLKLKDEGYLIKGSHPVGWCPKHDMPVGMHDTKDDVEPEIGELTIIKFLDDDGVIYPAATLRPETVLGVTNVWVNPEVNYCISEVDVRGRKEKWALSCDAGYKLKFQLEDVRLVMKVKGSELIGKKLINPITGRKVPILEAKFVSPRFGTGVVMSVPAHAPYDYVALRDLLKVNDPEEWGEFKPIPLIKVEGYSQIPAKDAVERLGIKSQDDKELLDRATKEVYRDEHLRGKMLEGLSELVQEEIIKGIGDFLRSSVEGRPVEEARKNIREFLLSSGYGATIYEIMNAPVYCRCGTEIVVKVVKDQWFIDYGNPEWKRKALEALASMRIVPEEARKQFVATIDWLKAKACARSRGLGTELPWAKGWVIESLSDSTIYMAFYTVIHKIRSYGIKPDQLTPEFWDFIMLGKGDPERLADELGVSTEELISLRSEFDYWYPLDSRHSGKDLIPNHLTFFIFNHAAIFPREKWPRQIVANGWVLLKGEKMSKSKGNVRTLHGLIDTFSADAVRLALSVEAEVEADLNLDVDSMGKIYDHLKRIKSLVHSLSEGGKSDEVGIPEKWLLSRVARHLLYLYDELDRVRIRAAGVRLFFLIPKDLEDYLDMVKKPSPSVKKIIEAWVKVLSAYTPFLAEELWHEELGKKSFVVTERWPSIEELQEMIDVKSEVMVEYGKRLIEDIRSITRVVGSGQAIIYVAPKNMQNIIIAIRDMVDKGGKVGDVLRYLSKRLGNVPRKKLPKVGKALLDLSVSLDKHVIEGLRELGGIDELEAIQVLKSYIERKAGVKIEAAYLSTDPSAPDNKGRKSQALPWRPSIYIEGGSK